MDSDIAKLNIKLGSPFTDLSLLRLAVTHRSFSSDNNERLEFLGDSILNFVIAKELFKRFPSAREGRLSRMRAQLVKRQTLAEIARELQLGDYLIMGSGELKSGGYTRDSILSDSVEAVIGAVFTEFNIESAAALILKWFATRLSNLSLDGSQKDAKTLLQEYLQARNLNLPEYKVVNVEGKSHNQIFHVECSTELTPKKIQGTGANRRVAEQKAAETVLALLVTEK